MTRDQDNGTAGFVYDAASVPAQPGCYLMKDAAGRVIYVGKAKSVSKKSFQKQKREKSRLE